MSCRGAAVRTMPLLCLCLAGCSGLFQSKAKPDQIYYLRAPLASTAPTGSAAAPVAAAAAMPVSLRVVRPLANPGLETSRIMLVQTDHRMNFYSGSRWPAPVTQLVEALTVDTLRATGAWASVGDSASPFPSDYLLQIHVRRFDADYTEAGAGAPVVHVMLDCIVGRRQGRDVLATFTASGTATAAANRQGEVVAAFEQASGTALQVLAQQTEQAVRADVQRAAQNADKPLASISR